MFVEGPGYASVVGLVDKEKAMKLFLIIYQ